ncbi:MAG: phosphomannomutase, partial [Syntrophomonadaceae bacterium]|nr:phosphomannomutase [Syntrophomonadaceae bacterium]
MLNRNIFREFDIRGKVGQELDEDMARRIVLAFAAFVHERGRSVMLVGRDNRHSSSWLRDLTVEALRESGMDVVDLGELITPMFYFASYHLGIDAGLMITASHNPGDHNGFKLLLKNTTIFGEDIRDISRRASEGQRLMAERRGSLRFALVSEEYIREITSRIKLGERPLKVVVDCGSGTTSYIGPRVL